MTRIHNAGAIAIPVLIGTFLFVLSAPYCRAQSGSDMEEEWRLGIFAGGQILGHETEMNGLPGVPSCCPEYDRGSGAGIALGVSGEGFVMPRLLGGLRLLFATYAGTLQANEYKLVSVERDTATAIFQHTIETSQAALGVEAFLAYEVLPGLRLIGGARADLMPGGTYSQREEILSPANIRFENNERVRMVYEGDIAAEQLLHFAACAGLRYDIPINSDNTLLLSPEVMAWQGLTDLVEGESWRMRGLRAGLSLYFIGLSSPTGGSPLRPGPIEAPQPTPGSDDQR